MDKQEELIKKIYKAIIDTLGKEDVTIGEGLNALTSAVVRILYGCVATYPEGRKGTEKDFALDVLNQVIEQIKTMPDNVYFKGK